LTVEGARRDCGVLFAADGTGLDPGATAAERVARRGGG
jgi:hypothetical protein